jgi:GWxTD domain-containing protein
MLVLAWVALVSACGPWQRVGTDPGPDPGRLVPRLFDAASVYADMGLFAAGEPLPFIAGVRFLATEGADSTMAVFGVSLANRALSFRRAGSIFEGRYRVEFSLRRDGRIVHQSAQNEAVRVASFAETQRADESVVYQRFVTLPPGPLELTISVRDRNGTNFGRVQGPVEIPTYGADVSLSSVIPVYEAAGRNDRSGVPDLVLNPRATVPYGSDTLRLYLEAYGVPPGRAVVLRAVSREAAPVEVWRDTLTVEPPASFRGFVIPVAPEQLPIGVLLVEAFVSGGEDSVRTVALVSFSEQWVVANFDETLFLLKHFGSEQALEELRAAPPEERPGLWAAFWKATDPNPQTQEHEALEVYFRRLQEANRAFQEGGEPGWLTDRGEVFITIGPPDEIFDSSSDLQDRSGQRIIRWTYIADRLVLDFVDDTGFGRFRLTSYSRSEYQQVLGRIRRGG